MRGRAIVCGVAALALVLGSTGACAPATTSVPMALTGGASGASGPSEGCRIDQECSHGFGGAMGDVGVAIVGAALFGLVTALIGNDLRTRRPTR